LIYTSLNSFSIPRSNKKKEPRFSKRNILCSIVTTDQLGVTNCPWPKQKRSTVMISFLFCLLLWPSFSFQIMCVTLSGTRALSITQPNVSRFQPRFPYLLHLVTAQLSNTFITSTLNGIPIYQIALYCLRRERTSYHSTVLSDKQYITIIDLIQGSPHVQHSYFLIYLSTL
jgi:hypothetical protein